MARIDSRELSEWMVYYQIEPFGEERADIRQAITSCLLANIHRGKNQRAFNINEFMAVRPVRKPQSMDEMKKLLKVYCDARKQ